MRTMTKPNNFVTSQVSVADTRTETLMGKDYLVVPVVALNEMVLVSASSEVPELALAEEFGANPLAWNGRPVVVNHPEIDGSKVSASLVEVVDKEKIGEIYNSILDGKKLKLEAWIDTDRVKVLGGTIQATVDKLESGEEIIEVSTGLFANVEQKTGEFEGKEYQGIWRNIVPDHLAILSEATGACSINDGCGAPRVNKGAEACPTCSDDKPKSIFARIKDSLLKITGTGMTDGTKRSLLGVALRQKFGTAWVWLEAVYSDTVIYYNDDGLFELEYTMTEDQVTFGDEPKPVVARVEFTPPLTVNEGDEMDKEKFVNALIANEGSKFEEGDKVWLMELDEDKLKKLEVAEPVADPVANADGDKPAGEPEDDPDDDKGTVVSLEQYIAAAPAEVGSVLTEGLRLQKEKREILVKGVIANARNSFTEEQLEAMDTTTLENLAKLAEVDDYSGRPVPRAQEDTNVPPTPPLVFPPKQAQAS